jgi:hypothetical protein
MFFLGHQFGFLPWHNCQLEVLPMSLEDLLPMSPDHTKRENKNMWTIPFFVFQLNI